MEGSVLRVLCGVVWLVGEGGRAEPPDKYQLPPDEI